MERTEEGKFQVLNERDFHFQCNDEFYCNSRVVSIKKYCTLQSAASARLHLKKKKNTLVAQGMKIQV